MTWTFIQSHRVTRKLELVHSVIKWHEVSFTFAMVDYVREMAASKLCKYSQCGSFEHLLFCCCYIADDHDDCNLIMMIVLMMIKTAATAAVVVIVVVVVVVVVFFPGTKVKNFIFPFSK